MKERVSDADAEADTAAQVMVEGPGRTDPSQ